MIQSKPMQGQCNLWIVLRDGLLPLFIFTFFALSALYLQLPSPSTHIALLLKEPQTYPCSALFLFINLQLKLSISGALTRISILNWFLMIWLSTFFVQMLTWKKETSVCGSCFFRIAAPFLCWPLNSYFKRIQENIQSKPTSRSVSFADAKQAIRVYKVPLCRWLC